MLPASTTRLKLVAGTMDADVRAAVDFILPNSSVIDLGSSTKLHSLLPENCRYFNHENIEGTLGSSGTQYDFAVYLDDLDVEEQSAMLLQHIRSFARTLILPYAFRTKTIQFSERKNSVPDMNQASFADLLRAAGNWKIAKSTLFLIDSDGREHFMFLAQ